jgi:NAD(P)-dependent dehydrogenase (short-subunit alcohol dehydrogenase family)
MTKKKSDKPGARPRVFITGARRGIGRGIAWAFADGGYDVVVNDLVQDEAAAETLAGIEARGGRATFLAGNIADMRAQADLAARAFAAFGGLEVLVNNAGISVRKRGDMMEVTPERYDEQLAVNLRGPFFLTQEVARLWLAAPPAAAARPTAAPPAARARPTATPPAARVRVRSIITISSVNAEMVSPDRAEYCIAKTGLAMMTKLFAVRLADAGIGVFEIRPGIIRTDMTAVVKERYDRLIADGIAPAKRWGEPADVGRVALALADGQFHFSSGDAFYVDGGLHIHRM